MNHRLTLKFAPLALAASLGIALGTPRQAGAVAPLNPNSLTKFVDALPAPAKLSGPNLTIGMYPISQKLHRDLPPTPLWGYGTSQATATYPGPTIEAVRGVPTNVRWLNKLPLNHFLPVDTSLHWANPPGWPGNGVPAVVHLHGGEVEPGSDGHPDAWFTRDFAYKGPGWKKPTFVYNNQQPPTTLWYHDHALGITRLNTYAGLAGFYLLRDPAAEAGLGLPAGPFEREIVFQDRLLNDDGSLRYPTVGNNPAVHPTWVPEVFGDIIVVNGKIWPYFEVQPRKYRLRLLNGSSARFYNLSFENGLHFQQIGTDGGYLPAPVDLTSLLIAPGERADVIVDFAALAPGASFLLLNDANEPFPDGDAIDPITTGQLMQIRVVPGAPDTITLPATLNTIPNLGAASVTRTLTLNEVMDPQSDSPLAMFLDGKMWDAPISEMPVIGTTEIWQIVNLTMDTHPMHWHLVQFQPLDRQDFDVDAYKLAYDAVNPVIPTMDPVPVDPTPYLLGSPTLPDLNERGWKDTFRMNPGQVTRILVRFQPIASPLNSLADYPFDATAAPGYVWHCHIIDHEDNEMMRPYHLMRTRPYLVAVNDLDDTKKSDQFLNIFDATTGGAQLGGPLGDGWRSAEAIAVLHAPAFPTFAPAGQPDEDRVFATSNNQLLAVDPHTGTATLVGPIGYDRVDGLAFHPQSGALYGVTYGTSKLLRIDIATGQGTVLVKDFLSGYRLNDLAFAPNGDLYVVTDGSPAVLFKVNPATGAKLRKWTLSGGKSLESLVWSPDGQTLYSAADRGGYKDLCTIDLGTSSVHFVHPSQHSGYKDIEGLAWLYPAASMPPMDPMALARRDEVDAPQPAAAAFRLYQNAPNPFNPTTSIEFDLQHAAEVSLTIYDVRGREIVQLLHGGMEAGRHRVEWAGRSTTGERVASGIYYYTLRSGTLLDTRRMVLLK